MLSTSVKVDSFPNGEIQRVQCVRLQSWEGLDFFRPAPATSEAFRHIGELYREVMVPACPWLFGNMVLFYLPRELEVSLPCRSRLYGQLQGKLAAAAALLRQDVTIVRGEPRFRSEEVEQLWRTLENKNALQIISGNLPDTVILPVNDESGFLSRGAETDALRVNSHFFIFDRFDCATVYDSIGTPFGLCVKNGVIAQPPLFGREALLVHTDGRTEIAQPQLRELTVEINGHSLRHGENAVFFTRPERAVTPLDRNAADVVIINRQVAAVHHGGLTPIPAAGFVLRLRESLPVRPGDAVTYRGMEDIVFGIQVGNSLVINGGETVGFRSRFYNIRRPWRTPFPPCLFSPDYDNARAPRIALGADAAGKPMLLWAEGAGKFGYEPGKESRGVSLREMAALCRRHGMVNGVNLDGGGSAQLLLYGKKSLCGSDRDKTTLRETERTIPLGLRIE